MTFKILIKILAAPRLRYRVKQVQSSLVCIMQFVFYISGISHSFHMEWISWWYQIPSRVWCWWALYRFGLPTKRTLPVQYVIIHWFCEAILYVYIESSYRLELARIWQLRNWSRDFVVVKFVCSVIYVPLYWIFVDFL